MIGKIKGNLVEINGSIGLIETASGLFYRISLSPALLNKYKINQPIEIYTHLYVKDDRWSLYGFENKQQHHLFNLLISISGIGPKLAYSIICYSKVSQLYLAIKENNAEYFTKIPGLGKKTAVKIILELSQKLKEQFKIENIYLSEDDKTVVEALVALGYKNYEAKRLISKLPKNLSIQEKITQALKTTTDSEK